jgi:hypothetical protein
VVPPWQRQDGTNLQGKAGKRLPERLHYSASQISLCHLRGVEAHTTLSTLQTRQSGHRQASDASSHVANTQTNYQQPTAEPARRVLQRAEASNALRLISALASAVMSETATDLPALLRLHIDYAHSISIGVHKEKCVLLMTLDGIDFTFCFATVDRTEPESLIHEFMNLTRLKIDCIRYDGAAEFAKSTTFKAFCVNNRMAMEVTAAYTHTFNARAEGAVYIVKEHMRCLLHRANLPRRFWPYAMLHFCLVYAYWPDK